MKNPYNLIIRRIGAIKTRRYGRLRGLVRERMGVETVRPKLKVSTKQARKIFDARRRHAAREVKRQMVREARSTLGGVTAHARGITPIAIAGGAYLVGRQEPKIRRRIRRHKEYRRQLRRTITNEGIDTIRKLFL